MKNNKFSLEEIDNIASSQLYAFINVDVSEKIINDNQINFNFIVSDSEKFYVEKINIFGNFDTIEEVIRNNLSVDEGDAFNKLLHKKSINNIKSLNFFSQVDSEILQGSTQKQRILNI